MSRGKMPPGELCQINKERWGNVKGGFAGGDRGKAPHSL